MNKNNYYMLNILPILYIVNRRSLKNFTILYEKTRAKNSHISANRRFEGEYGVNIL